WLYRGKNQRASCYRRKHARLLIDCHLGYARVPKRDPKRGCSEIERMKEVTSRICDQLRDNVLSQPSVVKWRKRRNLSRGTVDGPTLITDISLKNCDAIDETAGGGAGWRGTWTRAGSRAGTRRWLHASAGAVQAATSSKNC